MRVLSRNVWLPFALGAAASLAVVSMAGSQQPIERRYINLTEGPARPYSQAVQVGSTVYVSGRTGRVSKSSGDLDTDLENEIRPMLDGVQETLKAAGMTMDDLVWVQVFCTDLALYDKFNNLYRTYFKGPLPARAFIGTSVLLNNSHFEIMGIAVKK